MFRGRGTGRGRGGRGGFPGAQKVPLKGRFIDGVWHCNCEPRQPADRFQTKNGGSNHGRWFYTCQRTQHTRCGFFLWEDESKQREKATVLSNSRSEPKSTPQTPTKSASTRYRANSPADRSRTATPDPVTPQMPSKGSSSSARKSWSVTADAGKDSFEWPSSDEDEMAKVADLTAMTTMPRPETPRKATKTDLFSSPGKRRFEEMDAWPTPATDDVFTTPTTGSMRGKDLFSTASAAGLPSPAQTPTPNRFKEAIISGSADDPELVKDVINTLHGNRVHMDSTATEAVKTVLNKHALKAQGIGKGRDISRLAIKSKDAKIEELQARIAALEAERETNRAVIRHLRRDMEMGSKR